jgi:hypothetical protein
MTKELVVSAEKWPLPRLQPQQLQCKQQLMQQQTCLVQQLTVLQLSGQQQVRSRRSR